MTRAKTPGRPLNPARPGGMRRRALRGAGLTLAAVLALGLVVHGFGWLWLTGAMAVGFSDWVTQQRAQGWAIEHDPPARGGWPFAARISVPAFRMAGWPPFLPQGFAWDAGAVRLTIGLPRVNRLVISADGAQQIRSAALAIPFHAALMEAAVPLEPGPGPRPTQLAVAGLRAQMPGGPVAIGRIDARVAPGLADGEPRLSLQAVAQRLELPPQPGLAAFGREVAQLAVDAALTGPPTPPVPMTPREMAEAWRAGGGALEVNELTLEWGPLMGALRMTLRLDAALQPAGQGRLVLDRPAEAIGALAEAGAITPAVATSARVMAGMMARPPREGGPPRLDVPVALEGGVVSLARLPVLRLPAMTWPDTYPR